MYRPNADAPGPNTVKPYRQPRFALASAITVLLTLTGCSLLSGGDTDTAGESSTETTVSLTTTVPTTMATTTTEAPDPVADLLAEMSLDAKIGQLLMPVVEGTSSREASPGNVRLGGVETPVGLIAEFELGGIVYLGPNIVDASQLTAFSAEIQASSPAGIGMLISVDQEGGRVQRITDEITPIPSARDLGGDPVLAEQVALQSAVELRNQGINLVLAPVADLVSADTGVINDRSFGSDPEMVAAMVTASINGFRKGGVAATVKHWPGHGATVIDSHESLPILDLTRDVWENRELIPFQAAFDADVDMVMIGHLAIPSMDPSGDPATISPVLTEDLLRGDYGFEGVAISDAMNMGALGDADRGELGVKAIEAGIDILLGPPDLVGSRDAIRAAVASGRLSEARLDESVERILTLKLRLGLLELV